jgi:hypothetical protein
MIPTSPARSPVGRIWNPASFERGAQKGDESVHCPSVLAPAASSCRVSNPAYGWRAGMEIQRKESKLSEYDAR